MTDPLHQRATALSQLRQHIESLYDRLQAEGAFGSDLPLRHYPRGYLLAEAGYSCDRAFLVIEGAIRRYTSHAGKEYTIEIALPGDIIMSTLGYAFELPSDEWIEALSRVTVVEVKRSEWQHWQEAHPELRRLDVLLTEYHAAWSEFRYLELRLLRAEERYESLIARAPELIQFVALSHIANYLGVSLETLSRIRARPMSR